jgi:crossover junction endodeoxyribonuclease RusA
MSVPIEAVRPMRQVSFSVNGLPGPQGSKKGIAISKKGADGGRVYTGKVAMIESSTKVKPWRAEVVAAAKAARVQCIDGPVNVSITFYLPRPQGHYRTGKFAGLLRDAAPRFPNVKPDVDKLVRATLDALTTARAYTDDAVVVDLHTAKRYADNRAPGANIQIIGKAAA